MPRILYLQYTNPAAYPPLLHSASILADAGWEVLLLGIAVGGAASFAVPRHPRIKYQQLGGGSGGVFGPLKYAGFAVQAAFEAKEFKPDWIYASDALSAPAAIAIRQMVGGRVIYHEHDAPPVTAQGAARAVLKARDHLARTAEIVIAPSAARMAMIPPGSGKRFVVWNCPRTSEVGPATAKRADSRFKLVYHGSLSRDRLTPQFIDALVLLPDAVELHVFGYETQGHRGYAADLFDHARKRGCASRVRYHGAIPQRTELLHRVCGNDAGVSTILPGGGDRNLQSLAGASNKAFEYLSCAMPVIVTDQKDWTDLFVAPGYGVTCDPTDAASIAAAVNTLLTDRAAARQMGIAGRERVLQEWNYETQFAPVLAALQA